METSILLELQKDARYWILDSSCILSFFIQLKCVENNGYYLNKLWNKVACGFSFASIEHQESSIMNVHFSRNPLSHKGSPRFLMINGEV